MADIVLAEPNIALPPTQADLPYDDGVPLLESTANLVSDSWKKVDHADVKVDGIGTLLL